MALLERDVQLKSLADMFNRASKGDGVCGLLHGEAGIGKTALVRQAVAQISARANTFTCGCEALFTPRPLGPLVDLADRFPPSLSSALHSGHTYNGLFPAFLSFLKDSSRPTVLVIEDVHWADAGTLDFIRYICRRLNGVPAVLLLTYRDDEITVDHPLRRILGDLPAAATVRLPLRPLSRAAVEQMASQATRVFQGLYDTTAGNPFFVTEVLAGGGDGIPPSVLDAVITRLTRMSPSARELLDLCSVVPNRIELAVVDHILADADLAIDECVSRGILNLTAPYLQFRHELARLAVEDSLTSDHRLKLNRRVFDALRLPGSTDFASLSRLVHHAQQAAIDREVMALAPLAAREAAAASSHRDAAALYRLALKYATRDNPDTRATLLEDAALEFRLINDSHAATSATEEALALRRQTGDALRQGMNLKRLAVIRWWDEGSRKVCEPLIEQALTVLGGMRARTVELSLAHSAMSNFMTAWSEFEKGLAHGEMALSIAESLNDAAAIVEALHVTAVAKAFVFDHREACDQLERALAIANRMDDATGHLFIALQTTCLVHRQHARALDAAQRGIAYCESRDLDVYLLRLLDRRALSLAELGRWDEADHDLDRCISSASISTRLRDTAIFLRKRQDLRRGDTSVQNYWLELQVQPKALRVEYRPPTVLAACAEAAWFREDMATVEEMCAIGLADSLSRNDGRLAGPLLVWLKRIGAPLPALSQALEAAVPAPYAAEVAGDIEKAAHEWAVLACPYERALALIGGNEHQVRDALAVLDALGARTAAGIARRRLRKMGARDVGRGPQPRTKTDPLGLTLRERAVYDLLVQGESNADIAKNLCRSERTVENHVAKVFEKLQVHSRQALIARTAAGPIRT